MSRFTWLAVVGLAFTVCGCELDKPLSDPAKAKVDERLLGRWVGVSTPENPDADNGLLFIGKHRVEGNPDGIMESLSVEYDAKERTLGDAFSTRITYFSTTKVGSVEMLDLYFDDARMADLSEKNSYAEWTGNKKRSTLLMRYIVEGDQLKLMPVDSTKLDALAKAGKLKKTGPYDSLISAESLASYIEANGTDELFDLKNDVGIYKRIK
jgi:hypothetical protein